MAARYTETILCVKNYKHGDDVILMLQLTCLFYVVNKNIKKVLMKIKTIFLWLSMSVDNETISLNFRL
jgi:hypothetical protein